MQSKDIARRLGVDSSTVRRWARDYERYLSPTAQKAEDDDQRRRRAFTDDDLRVFWTIREAQREGMTHEEIAVQVAAGQLEGGPLPEHPIREVGDKIDLMPVSTAEARIQTLTERVSELSEQLAEAREKLDDRNEQVIHLEHELGTAKAEIANLSSKVETVRLEAAVEAQSEAAELRGRLATIEATEDRMRRLLFVGITAVAVAAAILLAIVLLLALSGTPGLGG